MSTSSSSQSPSTTPSTSPNSQPTALPSPTIEPKPNNPPFTPTPSDVLSLRHTLLHFVPTELANIIITYAEYWPVLTASREAFDGPAVVSAQKDGKDGWCYLLSPEVPRLRFRDGQLCCSGGGNEEGEEVRVKVEKVAFSVGVFYEEPEEGCEGESTGANSWLEAAILTRPQAPPSSSPPFPEESKYPETFPNPPTFKSHKRWFIHGNKSIKSEANVDNDTADAGIDPSTNANTTNDGIGFVDLLTSGDRVGVMCRDLYKGWVNCIYTVRVDVYYSV
ncbi:hypothetical protein K443DRAFT_683047 [Laccaria amethystina LaAM-08-1]|uniref:Uncharacterized protein n=1 Tax=Laccaria amethystina LaAM-08-1 TaxID=1095629 RepID=A0A0C9XCH0_9AGAR|nr:hypothetical protein K443DRAFT_683047 [Laccaria amethystina LaAM-08-1]